MKTRPKTRFTHFSLRVVVLLALCGSSFAQQVASPGTSPATTDTTSLDSDVNSSSASQFNQHNSLTASQIISILQQKPELVAELKSLVADQLQQQGIQTQADSISDEMLLSQISTNAQLRASITVWLRARGYVSAAEMDRLLSSAGSDETVGSRPSHHPRRRCLRRSHLRSLRGRLSTAWPYLEAPALKADRCLPPACHLQVRTEI